MADQPHVRSGKISRRQLFLGSAAGLVLSSPVLFAAYRWLTKPVPVKLVLNGPFTVNRDINLGPVNSTFVTPKTFRFVDFMGSASVAVWYSFKGRETANRSIEAEVRLTDKRGRNIQTYKVTQADARVEGGLQKAGDPQLPTSNLVLFPCDSASIKDVASTELYFRQVY